MPGEREPLREWHRLGELFESLQGEGFAVSFTMEDFNRQYIKKHLAQLTPGELAEALRSLPLEKRLAVLSTKQILAGLSAEQIRQCLDELSAARPSVPRKPRRKK
jgi:hypothetical protein